MEKVNLDRYSAVLKDEALSRLAWVVAFLLVVARNLGQRRVFLLVPFDTSSILSRAVSGRRVERPHSHMI